MQLYTIGFTQKSLRQFADLLRGAGVDGVVDIRLNNTSQLAGYAKRDDLAYILELIGIGYVEEKRLAPTADILDRYHRDHDWPAYERAFRARACSAPSRSRTTATAASSPKPSNRSSPICLSGISCSPKAHVRRARRESGGSSHESRARHPRRHENAHRRLPGWRPPRC